VKKYEKAVLERRSQEKKARKIALYLCCLYCTSHTSLTKIGIHFGISISGVTQARDRVGASLKDDKELELVKMLEEIIMSIVKV